MKFNATLYVRPDTIRIRGIEAKDVEEAHDRALEIAINKYTALYWELEELYIEEVEE